MPTLDFVSQIACLLNPDQQCYEYLVLGVEIAAERTVSLPCKENGEPNTGVELLLRRRCFKPDHGNDAVFLGGGEVGRVILLRF